MNSIASFTFSAQPLKCYVNAKGDEPVQVTCKQNETFCNYIIDEDYIVTRNCSVAEGLWPKVRCTNTSKFTSCLCDSDNCNYQCDAENCKIIQISRRVDVNSDIATYDCTATCKAEGKNTVSMYINEV